MSAAAVTALLNRAGTWWGGVKGGGAVCLLPVKTACAKSTWAYAVCLCLCVFLFAVCCLLSTCTFYALFH